MRLPRSFAEVSLCNNRIRRLLELFNRNIHYISTWVNERKFMEDLVVNRNGVLATANAPFFIRASRFHGPIGPIAPAIKE